MDALAEFYEQDFGQPNTDRKLPRHSPACTAEVLLQLRLAAHELLPGACSCCQASPAELQFKRLPALCPPPAVEQRKQLFERFITLA